MRSITIRRPDDWHVHFRDGAVLQQVVPFTARVFGRAIVMPNLTPPVTNAATAASYRDRIMSAVPTGVAFTPLMTCYLTDDTDPSDLVRGHAGGVFTAAKLYPAHATTNSQHGVTAIEKIYPVLEAMAEHGIPLLTHGEITRAEVDIFDREKGFIDEVLIPVMERFPGLKVVMEHITTKQGVQVVRSYRGRMGATITPQHLLYNRNAIFQGGLRPHMYCLPVLKREEHRLALRAAATSGEASFFLGTDTAPHLQHLKEAACGCAGVFSAPVALQAYLKVFAEEGALDRFEAFASLNGPAFYGLPPNEEKVTFVEASTFLAERVRVESEGEIVPLFDGEMVDWAQARGA
ncbi:dihydroorotase [Microvirga massiliensis]|uniref:dihydroorotase n=1 Tax=Microvirga massiliensis TaxID=1033741 RepID=UPI00062BF161|nr:dihydroorotase [Microvirga massiliensis]